MLMRKMGALAALAVLAAPGSSAWATGPSRSQAAAPASEVVDLDALAARFEVVGYRLGMRYDEVLAKMQAEFPGRPIQTGKIRESGMTGPEYDGFLFVQADDTTRMTVQFAPPQEGGGALMVRRTTVYLNIVQSERQGQVAPTAEAMTEALQEKYGPPTVVHGVAGTAPTYMWAYTDKGAKITNLGAADRCMTDASRSSRLIEARSGCGVVFFAYPTWDTRPFGQPKVGPELVQMMDVMAADHRVLNAMNARLDREAAEAEAAKRRATTATSRPRL